MGIRTGVSLMFASVFLLSLAYASAPMDGWKSLSKARYLIHGGSLADRQVPTAKDEKLTLLIQGQPAKEIFDSIGPDLPGTCSDEKGDRARIKRGLSCSYTFRDKETPDGPYRCWIGINLRTGDTSLTVSC